MKGHCSTGQSPQRAVAPMEKEVVVSFMGYVSALKLKSQAEIKS
jgi:hypothetical protein